jgi:hypothetical protein
MTRNVEEWCINLDTPFAPGDCTPTEGVPGPQRTGRWVLTFRWREKSRITVKPSDLIDWDILPRKEVTFPFTCLTLSLLQGLSSGASSGTCSKMTNELQRVWQDADAVVAYLVITTRRKPRPCLVRRGSTAPGAFGIRSQMLLTRSRHSV